MADILITGVDDAALRRLQDQAERLGRPVSAVARDILLGALHDRPSRRVADADRIRAMTPTPLATSSTDLIREERNRG